MGVMKGIQDKTILQFLIIITLTVLIYVNFFFEKRYVYKSVIIDSIPVCNKKITDDKYNVTGKMNVSFYYDKNEYTLPVKIHDNCYIYTKGSKVDVKFNIDDIPGTIEIKTNNFKWNLNLILVIILLGLILSYFYKVKTSGNII